jgi:hypothetical protein
MQKLNFSGGEPFIEQRGRYVGELTKYCKEELKLPSVSIISNGSLATEKWFREYGKLAKILTNILLILQYITTRSKFLMLIAQPSYDDVVQNPRSRNIRISMIYAIHNSIPNQYMSN